ncbi:unnamed protein product [Sphacelaria rigidula]
MVGSDAVIGLPDAAEVVEYELASKSLSGVTAFDTQELARTSVTQNNDGTTMTFTRPLTPADGNKQRISTATIIWAFGVSNELENHTGDNRGVSTVDVLLCEDDATATTPPTAAGTPAPTVAEDTPMPVDETRSPGSAETPVPSTAETTPSPAGGSGGGTVEPTAAATDSPPTDAEATVAPTMAMTTPPADAEATVAPTMAMTTPPADAEVTDAPTTSPTSSAVNTSVAPSAASTDALTAMPSTIAPTEVTDRGFPVDGTSDAPTAAPTAAGSMPVVGTTRSPANPAAPVSGSGDSSGAAALGGGAQVWVGMVVTMLAAVLGYRGAVMRSW